MSQPPVQPPDENTPSPALGDPVPPLSPPLDYAVARIGKSRPWAISEIFAWAIIVVSIITAVSSAVMMKQRDRARDGEARTELLILGRYAVGTNQLLSWIKSAGAFGGTSAGGAAAPATHPQNPPSADPNIQKILERLDRMAKSPGEQLRAAIVHGEVEGKAVAIKRIDSLGEVFPSLRQDALAIHQLYDEGPEVGAGWEGLKKRYGWFAELAASTGKPDSDPQRAHVLNAGIRTLIAPILIIMLGLLGVVVGLVLLIVGVVKLKSGRLKRSFSRSAPPPEDLPTPTADFANSTITDRRTYVQGFALYILGMTSLGLLIRSILTLLPNLPSMFGIAALPVAFLAGALWPIFRGQRWSQWRSATGLHAGRGVVREVFAGWMGYLAGLPLVAVGGLITIVLITISGSNASHPITQEFGDAGPAMWIFLFLLAAVWAPVTEELMFRGMLFAHLRERFGWWISALGVGFIFAIIHPQGWAAVPLLGAIGFVFSGIREWRGSIIGCIAAHALHNGMALLAAALMLA